MWYLQHQSSFISIHSQHNTFGSMGKGSIVLVQVLCSIIVRQRMKIGEREKCWVNREKKRDIEIERDIRNKKEMTIVVHSARGESRVARVNKGVWNAGSKKHAETGDSSCCGHNSDTILPSTFSFSLCIRQHHRRRGHHHQPAVTDRGLRYTAGLYLDKKKSRGTRW